MSHSGWNPELAFLSVVISNSTDLAVMIPNSTVKHKLFLLNNLTKTIPDIHSHTLIRENA